MMTFALINPGFSYLGDAAVSYSVTLQILVDGNVTAEKGLSTTVNLTVTGWADVLKLQIKQHADAYIAQYKVMMQLVNSVYPAATTPDAAMSTIAAEIAAEIEV